MDDTTLIEALKAAGHHDQAKQLHDRHLATQLREAGHEGLADHLANGTTPEAPKPERTLSPDEQAGQAILRVLERDGIIERKAD